MPTAITTIRENLKDVLQKGKDRMIIALCKSFDFDVETTKEGSPRGAKDKVDIDGTEVEVQIRYRLYTGNKRVGRL